MYNGLHWDDDEEGEVGMGGIGFLHFFGKPQKSTQVDYYQYTSYMTSFMYVGGACTDLR